MSLALDAVLGPDNGQPLYRRLLAGLRADIEQGNLQPGDLIPPETEIARRHGISRHTVRQAIVELAREGRLRRERGRGTFVVPKPKPMAQMLGTLYSFVHEMEDRGLAYETRVLHRKLCSADERVSRRLEIPLGAPVVEIEMLRFVEDAPLALEFNITPYERLPALLTVDLSKRALYDVMLEEHGVQVTFGREELRPVVLDRRQASLLRTAAGSPAFHVDRKALAGNEPVELRRSLVRGDRYLFRVELPAGPTT